MTDQERGSGGVRQAVWRWHFIAGLITLPFLLWLAVTGSIYLFETEIETALHRPLLVVEAQGALRAAPALIAAAEASSGGVAQAYVAPETATRSAEVVVADASGGVRSIFLDPYSGQVLGSLPSGWRLTDLARRLHGLALLGPVANGVIEAIAGWILILSATGVYLWWPRPGRGGALSLRGPPSGRLFWRDLHATIGLLTAVVAVFFALSGLMWSGVWGEAVHEGVRRIGQGVPAAMWQAPPKSGGGPAASSGDGARKGHDGHGPGLSWTAQGLPGRSSGAAGGSSLTLAEAATTVEGRGMTRHYTLSGPAAPDGVFVASRIADKAAGLRVIQIDRFSGEVLNDFSFADYGAASQAIEWGVSVHMGKEYSRLNQWLMFVAVLALIGLVGTGIASWVKRRKRGTLGAPIVKSDRDWRVVAVIILIAGLLFPLTGLMAAGIALIDMMIRRRPNGA